MGFFTAAAWILGALTAATSVASYTAAKKAQRAAKRPNDEQRGVLVNKESNVEQIPVIYGVRRVGGVRVFVATEGKIADDGTFQGEWNEATGEYDESLPTPTNEYLYVALVLCEGEVQDITDILIDDIPATDPKYAGLININVYKGSDNQTNTTDDLGAADLLTTSSGEWTSDHRLRGVAYLGMRFKWDEEAFSGIPEVTALVTGKKVYDPRTATTAWSDNPALCIRDYLTNTRYGKGIPASAIDDVAIADAADDCDESVTLYDGGGSGKLFTCNAVLDTSKTLFDNLNILLLGCRGFLPYSQGQYRLKIDGSRLSEFTFTTDEIIDGIVITGESKDEKLNRVSVKFPNPDANWQPDTAIWPPAGSTEETTFLAEDGGILLQEDIDLDTITNYYQARDLARVLVLRSRNALTCSIKTTSEALKLEIADVISITHPTPGWIAKPFQVTQMQLNEDGTVSLNLLEYDSTIYTWEEGTEQTAYPDTNLPNPFTVASVSNITVTETTTLGSDGTVIPTGLIEWDVSYDRLVNQYEIQYKLTSEADTEFKSIFTSVNKYEFYNAEVGLSVTIRIRAINSANVKGPFTSTTFTVNGDQAAPGIASNVSATAGYRYITVSWINPTDKDLARVDVYGANSPGSNLATLIGSISGNTFVDSGLNELQTRYYYVKTVDFSGNESNFSAEASATVLANPSDGLDGADGEDGSDGISARAVNLTASVQGFAYDTDGLNPSPTSSTITATALNTVGTVFYEFFLNDVSQQNSTSSTYSYTPQANNANMPDKVEVQIREGGSTNPILARDQITLAGVQAGQNGVDAISALLSNEAHTLPSTSSGQVNYADSGTFIGVSEGATLLNYDGLGTSNGTWTVSANGYSITPGLIYDAGVYAVVANQSGMTNSTASIIYTISGRTLAGESFSFEKQQSFSKSTDGQDGVDGVGIDGADGPRSASGYIYYAFARSSAPSSPTLSGFNFVTGQFSTVSSGWSTAVSVPTPQEGTSFWAVRYAVSESTFGGSQTITKSAVFEWQNFDGLVTFTNIQDGIENNVTSIDGGKISTTSLSAINADLGTITAGVINTAGGATKLSLGSDGASNSALYVTRTNTVGGDGVMVYLDDSTSNSGYYRVFFNSDNGDTMRVDGNGSGSYVSQVASESFSNSIAIGFDVRGYSDTTAQFIQRRNAGSATGRNPALRTRNTSSGAEAKFSTGDGYAAYVVSGSIGPFTASHDSVTPKSLSFDAGDIVIDNGVVGKRGVSDVICYGDKSISANQAGAIGVFVSRRELTEDNPPAALIDHTESVMNPEGEEVTQVHISITEVTAIKETHDISIVNSIGEGQINVCGEGGDIQIGDLIVTSSMAGKGMKQADDIIRSYTVAKARESATFSAGEVKQIACIYLCG